MQKGKLAITESEIKDMFDLPNDTIIADVDYDHILNRINIVVVSQETLNIN